MHDADAFASVILPANKAEVDNLRSVIEANTTGAVEVRLCSSQTQQHHTSVSAKRVSIQGRQARREHQELQGRLEVMAQMVAQECQELQERLGCKVASECPIAASPLAFWVI